MRRAVRFVALAAALIAFAPAAAAQSPQTREALERAIALKAQGDAAMDAHRYSDALAAYQEAYKLAADPALLYNEARARMALGDFPGTLGKLEQFRDAAPPDVRAKIPDLEGLIVEVRARVTTLDVHCKVESARIFVRGAEVGPACDGHPIHVLAGSARIEVRAPDHLPYTNELELRPGTTVTLEPKLVSTAVATGVVVVRALPRGSIVQIGRDALGPAPVETELPAGPHTVRVRHEGYLESSVPLTLRPGERRELDVQLRQPAAAVTTKWWFWGGIGAAVLGGTALAIALSTTESAPTGTMSPGQLRGP